MNIIFATSNTHKVIEAQKALGESFKLISPKELGILEDIPETGTTLEANACQKAMYIWNKTSQNCFADDTGLEVESLDSAPGVYTARYYSLPDTYSKSSMPKLDLGEIIDIPQANMAKLLRELKAKELISGINNRRARFRTVIAFVIDGKTYCFDGVLEGEIARELSGNKGFGYDPIFIPKGYNCTLAEISLDEKNAISHRGKALRAFSKYINTLNL